MNKILLSKKEDAESYKILLKQARISKSCVSCGKPLNIVPTPYCESCYVRSVRYGTAQKRIKFSEVGSATINYQQHLHRKFFNCNAPIKYRGIKENRIYNNIEPSCIDNTVIFFHNFLTCLEYPYNKMYLLINSQFKNTAKRIVYNLVLHYIAYYKYNLWDNDSSFKSNTLWNLLIHIERTYIRTIHTKKYGIYDRLNYNPKKLLTLQDTIHKHISPLIQQL